jgi:hypothetical protein
LVAFVGVLFVDVDGEGKGKLREEEDFIWKAEEEES